MATIEVVKGTNGQFRFRIKASNGQIIATGESYKQKQKVMQVLRSLKSAVNAKVVDLTTPKPASKTPAKSMKRAKATSSRPSATNTKSMTAAKRAKPPAKPDVKKAAVKRTTASRSVAAKPEMRSPRQSIAISQFEADEATVMEGSNTDPQTETEMEQTPEVDEAGDTNGGV